MISQAQETFQFDAIDDVVSDIATQRRAVARTHHRDPRHEVTERPTANEEHRRRIVDVEHRRRELGIMRRHDATADAADRSLDVVGVHRIDVPPDVLPLPGRPTADRGQTGVGGALLPRPGACTPATRGRASASG